MFSKESVLRHIYGAYVPIDCGSPPPTKFLTGPVGMIYILAGVRLGSANLVYIDSIHFVLTEQLIRTLFLLFLPEGL